MAKIVLSEVRGIACMRGLYTPKEALLLGWFNNMVDGGQLVLGKDLCYVGQKLRDNNLPPI